LRKFPDILGFVAQHSLAGDNGRVLPQTHGAMGAHPGRGLHADGHKQGGLGVQGGCRRGEMLCREGTARPDRQRGQATARRESDGSKGAQAARLPGHRGPAHPACWEVGVRLLARTSSSRFPTTARVSVIQCVAVIENFIIKMNPTKTGVC